MSRPITWRDFWPACSRRSASGLIGFSYGARITCGALHLLGGGSQIGLLDRSRRRGREFASRCGPPASTTTGSCRATITARPCKQAERWFITHQLLRSGPGPLPLRRSLRPPGRAGLCRNVRPQSAAGRAERADRGGERQPHRRQHARERPYLYSLYIQNRTRDYALWHELGLQNQRSCCGTAASDWHAATIDRLMDA